jgi:hypothetical protein
MIRWLEGFYAGPKMRFKQSEKSPCFWAKFAPKKPVNNVCVTFYKIFLQTQYLVDSVAVFPN